MDLAIAMSQGAGLAVACGLAALLPVGVLAVAAWLGWTPGAISVVGLPAVIAGAWVGGLIEAAVRLRLPLPVRMAFSAIAASAVFEATAGGAIPWIGLVLGAPLGAITAWAVGRLADGALAGGGTMGGVTALLAGGAIAAAAIAIIPFAGFALVVVAAWLAIRTYRADRTRYAGLRVLK